MATLTFDLKHAARTLAILANIIPVWRAAGMASMDAR